MAVYWTGICRDFFKETQGPLDLQQDVRDRLPVWGSQWGIPSIWGDGIRA